MEPKGVVFIFVVLLSTLYLSTIDSCEIYKFVANENQALEGHVIKTVVRSLVNLCWNDCVWLSWCMSINVRLTNHGTVECDLNNSSKRANPGSLVPRQGSQYHEMRDVPDINCKYNECKRKEDLGAGWYRYGKAAIKLFQQLKNWTDARIFCQSLGGDLVSISSSHENDFVYDVFVKGLNLTYGQREMDFPDVHWKFNGFEPGVSFHGTQGGVRYQSDEGENALFFSGNGGYAEIPAVPYNVKGFTIAVWLKYLPSPAELPTVFLGEKYDGGKLTIKIKPRFAKVRFNTVMPPSSSVQKRIEGCLANVWCHFTFTWNQSQSLYRLVLNGEKQVDYNVSLEMKQVTLFQFGVAFKTNNNSFLHGYVKHFMIFNKTLDIHEVQTAMYWHEQGVWIGLNDQVNTNVFQWSDGTPVSQFKPLPSYNPQPVLSGRKCVAMRSNRNWLDKYCLGKKPFICKRPAT